MTKKELIKALELANEDEVIFCADIYGGWDNIIKIDKVGTTTAIIFGRGSSFL